MSSSSTEFLIHSLLHHQQAAAHNSTSRSPSPACTTSSASPEVNPEQAALQQLQQLAQLQFLWQQPQLLTSFLALCQLQQQSVPKLQEPQKLKKEEGRSGPNSGASALLSRKRHALTNPVFPESNGKRAKQARKGLDQDVETNSPVSGMFIKDVSSLPSAAELQKAADELDDTAAFVNVTEDSRRAISAIPNVIGDCVCALCKVRYDDVFRLAQHKCPRIAHEEYRCPECEKVFSCPANLASHRRWHRPRDADPFSCPTCSLSFSSRKHLKAHDCLQSNATSNLFMHSPALLKKELPSPISSSTVHSALSGVHFLNSLIQANSTQ